MLGRGVGSGYDLGMQGMNREGRAGPFRLARPSDCDCSTDYPVTAPPLPTGVGATAGAAVVAGLLLGVLPAGGVGAGEPGEAPSVVFTATAAVDLMAAFAWGPWCHAAHGCGPPLSP